MTRVREPWRGRASDHFDVARQRFFNPWKDTDKTVGDVFRWWRSADRRSWPRRVENRPYPPPPVRLDRDTVVVTFIGHATTLLRLGETTVLTDPHFSTHAGAFGRWGAPRVRQPGVALETLPPLDAVFVSHSHYDHLDLPSIRQLANGRRPVFVTGLGIKRLIERCGASHVVELDWWESCSFGDVTFTYTPAQHWSNRSPVDRRTTLWGGCHVRHRDGPTVYFAGDSGYAPCFSEIRRRLGPPDVALLPIGAYEPRWIMQDNHMNPDDAVRAHLDLGARTSLAIHHGCFRLSDEGFEEPADALEAAMLAHAVDPMAFRIIDVGESLVLTATVNGAGAALSHTLRDDGARRGPIP